MFRQGRYLIRSPKKPKWCQRKKLRQRTWSDFLSYLSQKSPATATNLGYGNLLNEIDFQSSPLLIEVAFAESAAVFKEYVEEKDVHERLKNHLADFFDLEVKKFTFKTRILSNKDKEDKNFKSKIELEDEARSNRDEERRQIILKNQYVSEAEKLFNSKVDKIVLND